MKNLRTFIALEFNKNIKQKIYNTQKMIKDNSISGRFKYADNFHLTLRFLGETEPSAAENIYKELSLRLGDVHPFHAKINDLGCFGKGEKISTIYLKVEDSSGSLYKTALITEEVCEKNGFKKDKKFVPHVTIAQEVILNKPFEEIQEESKKYFDENILFDKVTIIKSEQIQYKRVYTPLYVINLK